MSANPPRPLCIWRLLDGKPGHEKQTAGLVAALARKGEVDCRNIRAGSRWEAFGWWLAGRFPPGKDLPGPHLLVGAGHATHLALLAARRARGGRAVVLMKPSLPLSLFDLCLIPEHDNPPARANVVATRGVLNPLSDLGRHRMDRGLILIGGPSPHYEWDSAAVARQVASLVAVRQDVAWRLTTSRRTPSDFLAGLPPLPGLERMPVQATPPGWVEDQLAEAGEAWCTPDSVSMVYEALSAGCQVGLLALPARQGSRVAAGVMRLRDGSPAAPGPDWRPGPRNVVLDEAGRCAALIRERWFAWGD